MTPQNNTKFENSGLKDKISSIELYYKSHAFVKSCEFYIKVKKRKSLPFRQQFSNLFEIGFIKPNMNVIPKQFNITSVVFLFYCTSEIQQNINFSKLKYVTQPGS